MNRNNNTLIVGAIIAVALLSALMVSAIFPDPTLTTYVGNYYGNGGGLTNIPGGAASSVPGFTNGSAFLLVQAPGVWTNAVTNFVTTSGNDGTFVRGDSTHPALHVSFAISNSVPGDTVNIAAGNYQETNRIVFPKNLAVTGAGLNSTFITNWAIMHLAGQFVSANAQQGALFLPGDNCSISNLTIVCSTTFSGATDFQSIIGTSTQRATDPNNDPGFTNVFVGNVAGFGNTDIIYVSTTNHCQMFIFSPVFQDTWDYLAINGFGALHDIEVYGGGMTNIGADPNGTVNGGILLAGTNNVLLVHGSSLFSDKTGGNVGFVQQGGQLILSSCTYNLANAATWLYFGVSGTPACTITMNQDAIPQTKISNPVSAGVVVYTNRPTLVAVNGGATFTGPVTATALTDSGLTTGGVLTNAAGGLLQSTPTLPNTLLANSSITVQGVAVPLGGSTLAPGSSPAFNAVNFTNWNGVMNTNNGNGNALVFGGPTSATGAILYETNITVATTLAAFDVSHTPATASGIKLFASCSGGTDRILTFPNGCTGAGLSTPPAVTITNAKSAWFDIVFKPAGTTPAQTNVFWSPVF